MHDCDRPGLINAVCGTSASVFGESYISGFEQTLQMKYEESNVLLPAALTRQSPAVHLPLVSLVLSRRNLAFNVLVSV